MAKVADEHATFMSKPKPRPQGLLDLDGHGRVARCY